jgi:hypothetical protein
LNQTSKRIVKLITFLLHLSRRHQNVGHEVRAAVLFKAYKNLMGLRLALNSQVNLFASVVNLGELQIAVAYLLGVHAERVLENREGMLH